MSQTVFITGATGNIGAALVCDLLHAYPSLRIVTLVRGHSEIEVRRRLVSALRTYRPELSIDTITQRLGVLVGDVSRPGLGLPGRTYARLVETTNYIVHSAALTCFGADPWLAEAANVTGTQQVLSLAHDIHRHGGLKRFVHVSTAYVCGHEATGLIDPDFLPSSPPETNVYENSKWRAERLVRRQFEALPVTIVRPSIVVGDSRTGRIINFNVLYPPLRLLLPRLRPGARLPIDGLLDVVPVDYVAAAIRTCMLSDPVSRSVARHLAAGPSGTITVGELLTTATALAGSGSPDGIKSESTVRGLIGRLKTYLPYLSFRGTFDCSRGDRFLAEHGIRVQPVTTYLQTLLEYCRETGWGKRPPREESLHASRSYSEPVFAAAAGAGS